MKRAFSVTGIITGVLLIIIGMTALCGGLGDADSYGGDSPYNSGYATFGADYYTYSVNNTAETANAVSAVNSNLREISDLIKNIFGWLMMLMGVMSVCGFGIVYAECMKSEIAEQNTTEMAEPEEYVLEDVMDEEAVIIEESESDTKAESDIQ